LNFSRQSFYTGYKQEQKDEDIAEQIQAVYLEEDDTLGAKKLALMLGISKNRCQRIMNKKGIKPRKKGDGYVYSGKSSEIYPNLLLGQQLDKSEVYYSDLFEFKLADETEVHGCFVFRRSTRQVVSLLFDYFETAELVERAIDEAQMHVIAGSIFHVDQGTQNGAGITVQKVKDLRMRISMSRAGTPTDNPYAERFVRTFKLAVVYRESYFTLGQILEAALKWVNFYNDRRPHESIDQKSPNRYAEEIGIKSVSLNRVFRV
jgi:putative transposase